MLMRIREITSTVSRHEPISLDYRRALLIATYQETRSHAKGFDESALTPFHGQHVGRLCV
jgi:hypothetical protein